MNAQRLWLAWAGVSIVAMICVALVLFVLSMNVDRFAFPAHESAAVGSLRNIVFAQNEFRNTHGCFASKLEELPKVTSQDDAYSYIVLPQTKDDKGCVAKYMVTASPALPGKTGHHYFSIDETGTIRYENMRPVDAQSRVLQ